MNKDKKKIRYVKITDSDVVPVKSPAEKGNPVKRNLARVLSVIGTTLVSMIMIVIITGCIVATGLTIYVMQFADSSFDVDLDDVELSFSSFVYAKDSADETVMIKQLNSDENRVWIDIENIPQHVLDAFISVEDERFFEHEGVDWKRTVSVSFSAIFAGGTDGGSTITQQLVRDITNDKDVTIGRKLREIFRAMSLEQKYTKLDILESYLNRISFGGTSYGIASAAIRYFNKDVSELTVAEAAILAGIVRSPSNFNPYANLSEARERQEYALSKMYENGYISTAEYDGALAEQVKFTYPVYGDDFGYVDERYNEYYGIQDDEDNDLYYENVSWDEINGEETTEAYKWDGDYEVTQNWYVDAALYQVVDDLAEIKGITTEAARELLYNGGFSVYLNMDIEMQNKVTELFEDPLLCLKSYDMLADKEDLLQASFVITDYSGKVLAVAGGLGEKEGDNCFNRATQAKQVIGSTVKPLAVYSLALENNLITYSTMIRNIAGKIPAAALGVDITDEYYGYDPEDDTIRWPHNYNEDGDNFGNGNYYPAWYGVEKSKNTMAINILSRVGLETAFTQLSSKLGFDTLDSTNDMAYSPLGLGAFTNGVQLYKLAAAYAIFGNGGLYYEPFLYSQVLDSDGKVVLEQNTTGTQVISSDTAWITNRMMKTVVTDPDGSGRHAQLENIEVIGKTGTANDMSALLFCGLMPSYVGTYRISYDDNHEITNESGWRTIAYVWHDVMAAVCDTSKVQNFVADPSVIETNYCEETGLIATSKCPSTKIGYYREGNLPDICDSNHDKTYWKLHADLEIPLYE